MDETKDWHFEFNLESVTAEQAEHLLDIITSFAKALGTHVGGGFAPEQETEDGKENA